MTGFCAAVVGASWLVFAVVWLSLAARVKRTVRTESVGSRVGHLLPLAIAFALLFNPAVRPHALLDQRFMPEIAWVQYCGALLTAAGIGFAVWARLSLGDNWSASVMQKDHHELIQSGPFAVVRHPIYTGMLAGMLGPTLVMGEYRCLLAVAIAYLSLWRKYRLEETFMIELFGAQYLAYRKRVPALIPLVA